MFCSLSDSILLIAFKGINNIMSEGSLQHITLMNKTWRAVLGETIRRAVVRRPCDVGEQTTRKLLLFSSPPEAKDTKKQ